MKGVFLLIIHYIYSVKLKWVWHPLPPELLDKCWLFLDMRVVSPLAFIYLVEEELHWCVQEDSFISVFLGSFYIDN